MMSSASVMCKMFAHVIYQLSSTVIYYQPPILFAISIIGQCLNFAINLMDSLDIFVDMRDILPSKSCGFGVTMSFHCHVVTIRVFLF